jgi:hypothetical protein
LFDTPTRGYRRGGSPAGLYTFRRPRSSIGIPIWCAPRRRLGSGLPSPVLREGFPEFTRFASTRRRAGPLFLAHTAGRCARS